MGKITDIVEQKKNKNRFNIYIDEVFAFGVSGELIYKEHLKKGLIVDEEKLRKIAHEENKLKCRESALRIIERSYKTEKEIKNKLLEKGYGIEEVNESVNFLKEYKFIDDRNYVKLFIKDRLRNQGKQKIKYSLKLKGISDEIIDEEISNLDREKEKEVALELASKKYTTIIKRESDKYKVREKLTRYLMGRGYDYQVAKDAVMSVLNID